jgi:microcystin-dependent protein
MKRIELFDEDFPFTPKTVRFLQEIPTEALVELAKTFGDNSILYGCAEISGNITAGAVIINGEILPIDSQVLKQYIVIEETVEDAIYKGDVPNPAYYTRIAKLSDSGTILFSSLNKVQHKFVPQGGIIMWSGSVMNIPKGWALCDGANGTPNLKGRFVVGYDGSDSDYNAIGKFGGWKERTIMPDQAGLAPHKHGSGTLVANAGSEAFGTGTGAAVNIAVTGSGTYTFGVTGETAQHNGLAGQVPLDIRPPYYTIAYIIKL